MTTKHPPPFPSLLEMMMIINTTIFNILKNKKIILEDVRTILFYKRPCLSTFDSHPILLCVIRKTQRDGFLGSG